MRWRQSWGEDRAYYQDASGRLCSFPANFTSLAVADPFVEMAAGRSSFRVEDLLRLVDLIRRLHHEEPGNA